MFECHVCGHSSAHPDFVSEVFSIDGRRVLVEHISAQVCDHCGEPVFDAETAERVRNMVRGDARPIKTVPLDVFALA